MNNTPNEKNKSIFFKILKPVSAGVVAGATVLYGYYQFSYEREMKWRDIRYQETKVAYESLLRKTGNLALLAKQGHKNSNEFQIALDDFDVFIDSDFALYHGDFVFYRTYQIRALFYSCSRSFNNSQEDKCDIEKINAAQYVMGNCARASLDNLRKTVDIRPTADYKEIIGRAVEYRSDKNQERFCGI